MPPENVSLAGPPKAATAAEPAEMVPELVMPPVKFSTWKLWMP
jgi:hypothetical protein